MVGQLVLCIGYCFLFIMLEWLPAFAEPLPRSPMRILDHPYETIPIANPWSGNEHAVLLELLGLFSKLSAIRKNRNSWPLRNRSRLFFFQHEALRKDSSSRIQVSIFPRLLLAIPYVFAIFLSPSAPACEALLDSFKQQALNHRLHYLQWAHCRPRVSNCYLLRTSSQLLLPRLALLDSVK